MPFVVALTTSHGQKPVLRISEFVKPMQQPCGLHTSWQAQLLERLCISPRSEHGAHLSRQLQEPRTFLRTGHLVEVNIAYAFQLRIRQYNRRQEVKAHTSRSINTPDKHCVYNRVYDKSMHVHSAVTARGKYKQQDERTHEAKTGTQCHPWCGTSGLELRTLTPTWCSWFPALAYAYMQRRLQSGIADQRWTCISAFPPHTGFCPTSGFHPFPSATHDSGWQWYTVYPFQDDMFLIMISPSPWKRRHG